MKKVLLLASILMFATMLGGCSKGISFQIGAIENNTKREMTASYTLFSGTKEKEIKVDDGETVEIAVGITTKDGSIDVYVYNENEEYSYEGHDIATSDFTVTLSEPGTYTLKLEADKHKGGYSFKW